MQAVILIATIVSGAVLMSLEILAFRVIGRTFGTALRETSMVISVFLTAMSAGYWSGGKWGDRKPELATLIRVLLGAAALMTVIPFFADRFADAVYASALPAGFHAGLVAATLFFAPTLLLASVSPIAIRIRSTGVAHAGSVAGSVSALSTAGSIAGSIGTAYILIDLFRSVDRSLGFLAFCTFAMAALLFAASRLAPRMLAFAGTALVAIIGAVVVAQMQRDEAPQAALNYGHVLLLQRDTPYHSITVRDSNLSRRLYFGRNYLQSSMSVRDPYRGGAAYTQVFHAAFAMRPIRTTLFVGVGGGTGPKEFTHDHPRVSAIGVDIDAAVVDAARTFFHVRESERLRLLAADGRVFLRGTNERFDAIVIDAYTTNRYGITIPEHLATREFFELVRSKLTPGGVVVFNCAQRPEKMLTRALSKTLYQVFDKQLMIETPGGNTVLFASAEALPSNAAELRAAIARARANGVAIRRELDAYVDGAQLLDTEQYRGVPILTDDYAPIDLLFRRSR